MKIEAPCRLGERFSCEQSFRWGKFVLTGLDIFFWNSKTMPGVTLCGKRDIGNSRENTNFFYPGDAAEGIHIAFEIPDEIVKPGYPLRELGMHTDAAGHLGGLNLTEDGWEYYIYYGKSYGGPLERVRTDVLDKLFDQVLPLHAVRVNAMDYLI